jgi:hypothetical protein
MLWNRSFRFPYLTVVMYHNRLIKQSWLTISPVTTCPWCLKVFKSQGYAKLALVSFYLVTNRWNLEKVIKMARVHTSSSRLRETIGRFFSRTRTFAIRTMAFSSALWSSSEMRYKFTRNIECQWSGFVHYLRNYDWAGGHYLSINQDLSGVPQITSKTLGANQWQTARS